MRTRLSIFLLLAALLTSSGAWAASSIVCAEKNAGSLFWQDCTITAHTDGTVTSETTDYAIDGIVTEFLVNPGTPAPQAAYDMTVTDSQGVDITNATALANLSATDSARARPNVGGTTRAVPVQGPLTIAVSNNNVNGAVVLLRIYYFKDIAR